MFPGIDGFHWTVGHVVFLAFFFDHRLDDHCDGRFRGMAHCPRLSHQSSNRSVLEVELFGVAGIRSPLPPRTSRESDFQNLRQRF